VVWWGGGQRQRNVGLSASMDPGSPSATSLGRPGIRCRLGKEKVVRIPGKGHEVPASRGPCRVITPRFSRYKITPPPLGEGRGGGCWRCQSQKASRRCMGALHPTSHPTSRIKQPPSDLRPPPPRGRFVACYKITAAFGRRQVFFLPPLGEGWGGGFRRCHSQKASRRCTVSPHSTPYIPHPGKTPSGCFAATSPRGGFI